MSRRRISAKNVTRWLRGEIDLARMLGLSADDRDQLLWQAHQRLSAGQIDESRRLFQLLGELSAPSQAIARLGEGVCAQALGQFDLAEAAYDAVLATEPKNPYALANRGEVRLLTGRVDAALADLNAAAEEINAMRVPQALRDRIGQLQAMAQGHLAEASTPRRVGT